jgi:hypothetical protein
MTDTFHADFAAALSGGKSDALTGWLTDPAALRRMAVYRNTVVRSVIEVLRAAYPAVNRIVGAQFFSPMAKAYWQVSPPRDPVMASYGEGFADFIAGYEPAAGLPYLADIARLDRAWQEAHQAAEHTPLSPGMVAALDPSALPGLAPGLHPSVRLCATGWAIYPIWSANRDTAPVPRAQARRVPEYTLIWRPQGGVCPQPRSVADPAFLAARAQMRAVDCAAAAAARIDTSHDAAALFGALIGRSHFKGLSS